MVKEITKTPLPIEAVDDELVLLEKRKILVRNIVDYIAGMTDSYAKNEFEKLR